MEKITRFQFYDLQDRIKHNYHLSIVGELWYSSDITGTRYLDKNNCAVLKSNKTGYYALSSLLTLLK